MNTATILSALTLKESKLVAELAGVRGAIASLRGGQPVAVNAKPVNRTTPKRKAKAGRAPNGALQAQIAKALADGSALTNGQLRQKIAADGYRHTLETKHIFKFLQKMTEAKTLVQERAGKVVTYRLRTQAPAELQATG